ncbi:MAG: hypothetical protein H8E20_14720 [Verrucomicrobia bacterium]|nr:hypothetical protein [Verrucomicrobiota bacterium]
MTVLIVALGVGLGWIGGWFGFRWRHNGRIFSESDRDYFQNLLFRAETAEAKLEQMEPELTRATDRANILEDSHRVIQEELANERQFNLSLNTDLSRERAHRKFLETKLDDQAETLNIERRRLDGELARLAKRIEEDNRRLTESLLTRQGAGEPAFAAAPY